MLSLASASGNVFAFLHEADAPSTFDGPSWARTLCPRGDGLGLDGLFLLRPYQPGRPWELEHWEPDGAHTFCSNGTRAAAALLPQDAQGQLEVRSSGAEVRLHRAGTTVGLRLPQGPAFGLREVPALDPRPHAYGWTGTPHLVVEVPEVSLLDLPHEAPPLRHHPDLPEGANVTFLTMSEPGRARIRTWERGVEGETLCCGQGACVAAAWLARRTGLRTWRFTPQGRDEVQVRLGALEGDHWSDLWLEGPIRLLGQLTPGTGLGLP